MTEFENENIVTYEDHIMAALLALTDQQLLLIIDESETWLKNNTKTFPKSDAWTGMLAKKFCAQKEFYRRFKYAK